MALLGENSQQRPALSGVDVPGTYGMLTLKIKNLLPACGRQLLAEASPQQLAGGEETEPECVIRRMPCGLDAADMPLPADTVRVASLECAGWTGDVTSVITPESDAWRRQWSKEPGIAGCAARPMAYLGPTAAGLRLRVIPYISATPPLLTLWRVPIPDSATNFHFPESLYPDLVKEITAQCQS